VQKKVPGSVCGYTYIELLVAITILGLVAAPLLALFTGSFTSIAEAGIKSSAVNLCREKMETLKAWGYEETYAFYLAGPGSPSCIEEEIPGHPHFRRVTEVTLLDPENESLPPGAEVLCLKVSVYRTGWKREISASLESRLARR